MQLTFAMSDEKYAEQENTPKSDTRITKTMPAAHEEGEGEEREDDSWLYECSVTAD